MFTLSPAIHQYSLTVRFLNDRFFIGPPIVEECVDLVKALVRRVPRAPREILARANGEAPDLRLIGCLSKPFFRILPGPAPRF